LHFKEQKLFQSIALSFHVRLQMSVEDGGLMELALRDFGVEGKAIRR